MATYIKRPCPIEAVQLRKDNRDEVVSFLGDKIIAYGVNDVTGEPHCIFKFGKREWIVNLGDYIVKTGTMNLFFSMTKKRFELEWILKED